MDWAQIAVDVVIPVAAILIPTGIAIGLARNERAAAIADRAEASRVALEDRREAQMAALAAQALARAEAAKVRRLQAGEGVIVGLSHLISLDVLRTPMQERLGELRGRIAVYRAWIEPDDISGDWLALKHTQGMRVWSGAMENLDMIGGAGPDNEEDVAEILDEPRRWAQGTIDTFSGWLSGHTETEALRAEGAALLAEFPDMVPDGTQA